MSKKETKETTSLDVLDVIYRALQAQRLIKFTESNSPIKDVDYDGDNKDGTIQLTLKDGTVWFLSSNDIKQDSEVIGE